MVIVDIAAQAAIVDGVAQVAEVAIVDIAEDQDIADLMEPYI